MARLVVEDSDDEFPTLNELVVKPRTNAVGTKGSVGGGRTVKERQGKLKENEETKEIESTKPKPRKRVLNQASENPLLRPIARARSSSISVLEEKTERRRGNAAKSRQLPTAASVVKAALTTNERSRDISPALEMDPSERKESNSSRTKTKTRVASLKLDEEDRSELSEIGKELPRKQRPSIPIKNRSKIITPVDSEEDTDALSDGLSDFIVNDSTFLDEDSIVDVPPPRSVRRLVKGRRRNTHEDSDHSDLDLQMEKLTMKEDIESPSSDSFILKYSPSQKSPRKVSNGHFTTPPGSPLLKPRGLASPKKMPQIPKTPHRPSMDAFWQQDVVNEWNDEYSPRKLAPPRPLSPLKLDLSPKKSPVKEVRLAKEAKKAFSQTKHELAEKFLTELDEKITSGEVSRLAEVTGGIKIIWSKKLNTTAGRANWKRETIRSSLKLSNGQTAPPTFRHHASIELAEKVIDDEDRLLNVIAHEFCHLANFMVSGIKTNPHGKEFKAWAAKCSQTFANRGIIVTTKHSYEIDYKYVWACTNCGLEFKRHSKSIDPARHQCGSCKCKLVQTKPVPRKAEVNGKPKISEYQEFVKENMKIVRKENPGSPQKDIMGLVGKRYQEYKASKLAEVGNMESLSVDERGSVFGSKEGTPVEDEVGSVIRKLDFLDLTSP